MHTDQIFLTNGCCENAGYVGASLMQRLGLEFGEYEGFFYPLTDAEARFIATDHITLGDRGPDARLGFTMLYQNRKWLAPVVEIYREQNTSEEAAEASRRIFEQLLARASRFGGHAVLVEDVDRVWIEIMLPFDLAMKHQDFDGWKDFLERQFFAGIGTAH